VVADGKNGIVPAYDGVDVQGRRGRGRGRVPIGVGAEGFVIS